MNINPVILEAIKKNHNMITTAQVIQLGFTRSLLSKYVQEGLLEREHQGIQYLMICIHLCCDLIKSYFLMIPLYF